MNNTATFTAPHAKTLQSTGAKDPSSAGRLPTRPRLAQLSAIAALLFLPILGAGAVEPSALEPNPVGQSFSDLTPANFFSTGWDEAWTRRSRGDGTPDMSLLRVQTNFLAKLFRTDYTHQSNLATAGVRAVDSLTGTVEYPFNRRIMLGLIGNYRWLDSRKGEDEGGPAAGAFVRLQWVDTASSSLATAVKVSLPNRDIGEKDSITSFAIAGWQDLASLGLKRVGLYYHLQEETLAGPSKAGTRRNDLTYAISLARTWTSPDGFFGNASTFVEFYGVTDLDGNGSGRTLLTVTPGIRATIARRHILMAGVEFPLNDPMPFERIIRATYIYNF